MRPGRNDPCPCGSGKKYKQCCLANDEASVVDLAEQTWRRIRAAIEGYAADMLRFIGVCYGKDAVHQAWLEFTIGSGEEFVQGHPNTELFFTWFFHHWTPARTKGNKIADAALYGIAPTRAFLARKGRHINPLLHRYLKACLESSLAFHEILHCEAGVGFTTRDVFTASEFRVRERAASSTLKNGDIIFGQVVPIQGIAMLEASSPFSFPPIFKTNLIQLRHRKELRQEPDMALRSVYFALAESYLNPAPPDIRNTDGDVLEPRTLYFDIESPQMAFDALKHLALGTSGEELLEDAKFDAKGAVVEVLIPWVRQANSKHAAMQTVLMGQIRIDGRKLTVEVNSAERAKTIRALLVDALGVHARYRRPRRQPVDTMIPPSTRSGSGPRLVPRDAEQEALMRQPEVRAHIESMQRRHYQSWPEIPVPALQGRTPLEAVKDSGGREMVEALITQFERDSQAMGAVVSPEVFVELRRRLGLSGRTEHPSD